MREKKICVLTLQETHLSEEYTQAVQTLYGKQLSIHFSACTENPTGKSGVAIVLNKDLVKTDKVETTELIPAPWHAGTIFTWLAIYAPNDKKENKEIMSRDFNFVEDPTDRLPIHKDNKQTVEAFHAFKKQLNLRDGWREANTEKRDFTYMQMSGKFSRSCIDRIYVSTSMLENCNNWEIRNLPILTDHRSVSVRITSPRAPYVGKGRWTMPLCLLRNRKVIKEVEDIVRDMAQKIQAIEGTRTESYNPQTIYAEGKTKITHILQCYAWRSLPIKRAQMEELQAQLNDDKKLLTAGLLQQKIQQIQADINKN
ncbi:hypothetical protein EDD18DRAFT_1313817 [Armillaria luteobubalina]|uniref:Endonuclease/exonuclease/phosphatase domain-containing protein n=1 Tax=Armillaria luteobubalina TaxID=153913 RepID=A0AA39NY26_9AGAR|nr:hypothetical protein EDD18DRAFT_1313817 [Armillaria luteobubalina]